MAKIAYVPYDATMDAIFSALGISISTGNFGGVTGWSAADYSAARAAAWDALNGDEYLENGFDYDNNGTDDWEDVAVLVTGEYPIAYWSTDSGSMPT